MRPSLFILTVALVAAPALANAGVHMHLPKPKPHHHRATGDATPAPATPGADIPESAWSNNNNRR